MAEASVPTHDRRWRVKSVPFAAHQTRVVRDEYVAALSYPSMVSRSPEDARWFTYILDTGASWKGPIGRERVTIDLSQLHTA